MTDFERAIVTRDKRDLEARLNRIESEISFSAVCFVLHLVFTISIAGYLLWLMNQ